jgi:hypothetical protein
MFYPVNTLLVDDPRDRAFEARVSVKLSEIKWRKKSRG